jgi:hypothetical protein
MAALMVRTQSRVMIIDPEDGVEKPKGLSNSNKSKKSKRIAKTALEEQVGSISVFQHAGNSTAITIPAIDPPSLLHS